MTTKGIVLTRSSATWRDGLGLLLDDVDTILATATFDPTNSSPVNGTVSLLWDSGATYDLVTGTTYRLIFRPTSASTLTMGDTTVNSNSLLDAYQGGRNFFLTTNTASTGGSWVDTDTRLPYIHLRVSHLDDGTGGGGGGGGAVFGAQGGVIL